MTVRLNPYLSFQGTARQAMELYSSIFGGKLTLNTFAEFHARDDPTEQDKVMHSMLEADDGLVLMGADTPNSMDYTPAAGMAVIASTGSAAAGWATSQAPSRSPTQPFCAGSFGGDLHHGRR